MSSQAEKGSYEFKTIEEKWQSYWLQHKSFRAEDTSQKPKYYVLDMFPYPSGDGLHVGHVEGYTASDVISRYKRLNGFNVLHPMGWDAFGLPAEQYAIKTNTHPRITTERNINVYRKQIRSMGFSIDWDREIDTTDPNYYKWTQWIFLKLYKKGLAYISDEAVNWCPQLGTVLADEEVVNGLSEVGGFPVEKRKIRQWVLKITEYADRLLEDLDALDWPESTKEMQRNWIGKSTGCYIDFKIENHSHKNIKVFTTRHDTLFGVSFCVLAPEHPLTEEITSKEYKKAVDDYVKKASQKSDLERTGLSLEKTGQFTGAYALHPVTGHKIPIYIADYVLAGYGTGAVMGVPGHDERDHEFATKYKLPILQVVSSGKDDEGVQKAAYTNSKNGVIVNSDFLNGLSPSDACTRMGQWLEEKGLGKTGTTYRLRDWIFSRQRYWGEPFPVAHDKEGNIVPISEEDLPVFLPEMEDFKPSGTLETPLDRVKGWKTIDYNGKKLERETNIMPQWAGSCWYYLRYLDPKNDHEAWAKSKENYWMPVDLYIGGVEHANLHLLYARFWHKVLFDLGLVSHKEPFKKLVHQGMILGENGEKMSKSRGNVVNPTSVIQEWGADSLRLYEMFMGPIESVKPWQTQGISGVNRFLKRVWRLIVDDNGNLAGTANLKEASEIVEVALAKTIKKVGEDTDQFRFNTAISAMMEFTNTVYKEKGLTRKQAENFVILLAPYAPHICEEMWEILGNKNSLSKAKWPTFDPKLVVEDMCTLSVMINGKMRGTITLAKDTTNEKVLELAKTQDFVQRHLNGKKIKKEIVVPGRVVNFVVEE